MGIQRSLSCSPIVQSSSNPGMMRVRVPPPVVQSEPGECLHEDDFVGGVGAVCSVFEVIFLMFVWNPPPFHGGFAAGLLDSYIILCQGPLPQGFKRLFGDKGREGI